ncbi:predicted membrane-bound serine protease, NfeD homolog [Thermococcus kodakarensis KOD1]|uniref:Predicted membrane-bound serine protease, NfeD homolog n=1 Tax=Thermococcus kodakarensis (strain ATCC BAA-918 / JCM 12380 / KOD1) TaxID=69014 RepID=Q5JG17_THEKO|nr:predicted membrane-bound serine protease, NfeD homolog [Thermococcus kodakarensis KOD1]
MKPMKRPMVLTILLVVLILLPSVSAEKRVVYVGTIEGTITQYTVDQFESYIRTAEKNSAEALIIELNTPGGQGDAMMEIVSLIQNSTVPVIIYVYPRGAIAASAGTYIAMASHLIAMAPGTSIGACEPILGYSANGSIVRAPDKIRNFYAAYMRSLAEASGRNETAAVKFVLEDLSLTPEEALKANVIEVIANDLPDLLKKANGMRTKVPVAGKGYVTFNFTNVEVKRLSPSLSYQIVTFLANPGIAYILLTVGMLGLVFGFLTPGWHVPETLGAILLVLGVIGMGYFGYDAAGLVLMILGVIFFIAEALTPTFGLFTIAGLVSFILGGLIMFGKGGEVYLVNSETFSTLRVIIIVTGVLLALFFLFGMAAVIRAHRRRPETGKEEMIGAVGKVVEDLDPEGLIKVRGELWKAVSKDGSLIKVGEKVRVVGMDGLTLIVEKVDEKEV